MHAYPLIYYQLFQRYLSSCWVRNSRLITTRQFGYFYYICLGPQALEIRSLLSHSIQLSYSSGWVPCLKQQCQHILLVLQRRYSSLRFLALWSFCQLFLLIFPSSLELILVFLTSGLSLLIFCLPLIAMGSIGFLVTVALFSCLDLAIGYLPPPSLEELMMEAEKSRCD